MSALLWIFFSDAILERWITDPKAVAEWQTYKGFIFVGITAVVLYGVLRRRMTELTRFHAAGRAAALEVERSRSLQVELLLNQAPIGAFLVDEHFRLSLVNPMAVPAFGDASRQLGRDFAEIMHEFWPGDVADRVVTTFRETLHSGTPCHVPEFSAMRADRQRTEIYDWRVERTELAPGKHGVVCYFTEISERVHAANELKRTAKRLKAFFESDLIGAIFWNMDGQITDANDCFLRMVGYTREELVSGAVSWMQMTPPEWLAVDDFALRELNEAGIDMPYEKEYIHKSGKRVPILVGAVMLDERRYEGVAFVLDITARKQVELRLQEAQVELQRHAASLEKAVAERTAEIEEVMKELTTFSYTVTHDLRAPLRTIRGFSDILFEEFRNVLPADAIGYIERIRRSASHMDTLITEVLAYSRVSQTRLVLEDVDPAAVAENIREKIFPAHSAAITISPAIPRVHVSRTALEQCFSNLFGNAVKFSRPDVPLSVHVHGAELGDYVRVFVDDNGVGIAPEHLQKVWGMFERLNPKIDGSGVGLAIVRRAVERMNGRCGVESTVGTGSKFWVDLPKATCRGASAGSSL